MRIDEGPAFDGKSVPAMNARGKPARLSKERSGGSMPRRQIFDGGNDQNGDCHHHSAKLDRHPLFDIPEPGRHPLFESDNLCPNHGDIVLDGYDIVLGSQFRHNKAFGHGLRRCLGMGARNPGCFQRLDEFQGIEGNDAHKRSITREGSRLQAWA